MTRYSHYKTTNIHEEKFFRGQVVVRNCTKCGKQFQAGEVFLSYFGNGCYCEGCFPPEPDLGEFPPLQGTEKQVAWAEKIRQTRFPQLIPWLESMKATGATRLHEKFAPALEKLRKQDSAKWWIDNRDLNPKDLLKP